MTAQIKKIFVFLLFVGLTACGGGNGEVGTSAGNPTHFPSGLTVASPLDTTDQVSGNSNLNAITFAQFGNFASRYSADTARIDQILTGTSSSSCHFDPALFLAQDSNAGCYGPVVAYSGHPDGPPDNSPLPEGDVGMWVETDSPTGHACAAAELNARLESMRNRSLAALMGLASLVCAANVNGIAIPTNSTEDLTSEMNGLGISGVTFNTATLTHSDSSGSDQYSYELDLDYNDGSDTFEIHAELTHIPGSSASQYQGRLAYRVNDTLTIQGGCPSPDQTYNASLLYNKTSANDLNVEVRSAHFCEHDSNGLTDGLVDPSEKYDPGPNPTGWANNFNLFTADFDPTMMEGDYSYAWQAGESDFATRVFNINVDEDSSTSLPEASAFYGYGDDIEDTDGSITGFFCNWAGPNGVFDDTSRTPDSKAQFQSVSFNSTTGKFDADTSNIIYAPTLSCDYDGSGTFTYDSDADGTADTDPATLITNDLIDLVDSDSDGVFDAIANAGFTLPTAPPNI